jgi:sugar phosphate isomerase/epimerase
MLTGLWFVAESATLLESLQRAAALGFHFVDLHGVFHAGPAHLNAQQCTEVKVEMAALGLKPRNYVLHAPHNLASADEGELEECFEYLVRGIDMAVAWGINQLMLNAGQWAYGVDRAEAWMRSVRFMQRICDYAAPREVYIAQEAEPYVWFLVNDIASTVHMLEDVGRPNFCTLVDFGHMALAHEGPKELGRLGDSIIHAHFSDHQLNQHTNQIIGTGITRTVDYLDALCRMGIDRRMRRFGNDELVASFELGVPRAQIDDPDEWVRQSLQHLAREAPYVTL